MHEVGIMESALGVIRREAGARNAARVERVVMRIGVVSGVEPDALRFAFEVLAPGSIVEGAELEIEVVPASAHCAACDRDFVVEDSFILECPDCHALSGDIRSGRELELARLDFLEKPVSNHA